MAPLTFTLFSLGGIRFVFDIPSVVSANWPFRLIATDGSGLIRTACRKLLLMAGLLPVMLIWFPVAVQQAGWRLAVLYFALQLLFISLTVELLLWKFQKIPFTCPFAPSRDRLLQTVLGILLFVLVIQPALSRAEAFAMEHPLVLLILGASISGAAVWLYRNGGCDSETLRYEDGGTEAFVLLRLTNE
jgi:hypothetical protein